MPRRSGSSSSMISIARTFGAPVRVPAGKHAANASSASRSFLNFAFDRRHDVHHVRVALDKHQVAHLHRAVFTHAAYVIAAQIDEHHVLGKFFFVRAQFLLTLRDLRPHRVRAGAFRRLAGIPVCVRSRAPASPATSLIPGSSRSSGSTYTEKDSPCAARDKS